MPSKPELVFAPMQADDFEEVRKLWLGCDGMILDARSDSREQIHFYLQRNPGLSQVVRDGGQIVAAVLCGHDGRRGYLSHLAVHPDYRRAGLARQMVQKSLSSLAAVGIPGCNIRLFTKNELGRKFWKEAGWQLLEVEVWIADTPDS
ncbi:MAG: GNAT family N-acetyltransferase [Planctomycetes bacterium]|nr:GNAT family N-acetyltransferase [Planctomycetota bacterium]